MVKPVHVVTRKFQLQGAESLNFMPDTGERGLFQQIRSAGDFQSFLQDNYREYCSLVNSDSDSRKSDSLTPRPPSPLSFHDNDDLDAGSLGSGAAKREKGTMDTLRSSEWGEGEGESPFGKKIRIFLK